MSRLPSLLAGRSIISLIVTVLSIALPLGCGEVTDPIGGSAGEVAFHLSLAPAREMGLDVAKVTAELGHLASGDALTRDLAISSDSLSAEGTIDGLRTGDWQVCLFAYDAEDTLLASGCDTVEVRPGMVTPVVMVLDLTGGLEIYVTWGSSGLERIIQGSQHAVIVSLTYHGLEVMLPASGTYHASITGGTGLRMGYSLPGRFTCYGALFGRGEHFAFTDSTEAVFYCDPTQDGVVSFFCMDYGDLSDNSGEVDVTITDVATRWDTTVVVGAQAHCVPITDPGQTLVVDPSEFAAAGGYGLWYARITDGPGLTYFFADETPEKFVYMGLYNGGIHSWVTDTDWTPIEIQADSGALALHSVDGPSTPPDNGGWATVTFRR